jgi:hypothetical protein
MIAFAPVSKKAGIDHCEKCFKKILTKSKVIYQ